MPSKRLVWPAAMLFLVAGVAFRLWQIFSEPLWLDEAYSAFAADHGFRFLWQVVPRYETHPPFYYSLLHLWVLVAGDSVPALRLPGLLAGLATLPLMARTGWEIGGLLDFDSTRRRSFALVAAALAALSTELIEMTHQVRPYPLMILVYAGAILLLVRLRRRSMGGLPIGGTILAGYLACVELMLWLHNMGPLYGVALTLALAVAVVREGLVRRDWVWLVAGHLVVAALYLPGLLILLGQAPTWVASSWVRLDWPLVLGRLEVMYAGPDVVTLAAIALAGAAIAAGLRARSGGRLVAMLVILATLPLLLSLLISITIAPVFIMRTMTPVAVPAVLLYALGGTAWDGRRRLLGLGGLLILVTSMPVVDVAMRQVGPMENWYGAVDWLRQRFRPGDQIFAYPNEGALPLGYALRDKGLPYPVRPIPGPVPTFAEPGAWYPTGSQGVVSLTPTRLHAIAVDPRTEAVPTIWLLRLGKKLYDPGDVFLRELHRNRYIVRSWQAGAIEIVGLRRRPVASSTGREDMPEKGTTSRAKAG